MLVIDGYGVRVGYSDGAITIRDRDGGEKHIPLSDVDAIILATSGISVSSMILRVLASTGIELIVMDHRGDPVGIYYSSHYTRTPMTRRSQYLTYNTRLGVSILVEFAETKQLNI